MRGLVRSVVARRFSESAFASCKVWPGQARFDQAAILDNSRQLPLAGVSRRARIQGLHAKRALISALLLTGATNAYAQDAQPVPAAPSPSPTLTPEAELPPQGQADPGDAETITVTGSRIVRNGYDAPTPVTVIGLADIQAAAPANVADFVNQIPSVAGSVTLAHCSAGCMRTFHPSFSPCCDFKAASRASDAAVE